MCYSTDVHVPCFYVQSWPYFLNLLSSLTRTCLYYVLLSHTIVFNSVVLYRYADCTEALNFMMTMSSLLIDTIQKNKSFLA